MEGTSISMCVWCKKTDLPKWELEKSFAKFMKVIEGTALNDEFSFSSSQKHFHFDKFPLNKLQPLHFVVAHYSILTHIAEIFQRFLDISF